MCIRDRVSHDRYFLDKVVTSLLVMKDDGTVEEQAGGYSDWEARGGQLASPSDPAGATPKNNQSASESVLPEALASSGTTDPSPGKKAKLSYNEQRELDALPAKIEQLENKHAALIASISEPEFYNQAPAEIAEVMTAITTAERALDEALERLVALEG